VPSGPRDRIAAVREKLAYLSGSSLASEVLAISRQRAESVADWLLAKV
jgi:hypothetical protein